MESASFVCVCVCVCVYVAAAFACVAGFVGANCNIDVDECASNACQNGAACLDSTVQASVAADSYTCLCVPGFTGINCEVDINECLSSPCANGAVCGEGALLGKN